MTNIIETSDYLRATNRPYFKVPEVLKRQCHIVLLAILLLTLTASAKAQGKSKSDRTLLVINASAKVTDEEVRGSKKIRLTHVNTLRYDVGINRIVTFTPGLSLSEIGGFLPKSPAVSAGSAKQATLLAGQTPPDPNPAFDLLANRYDELANDWADLQRHIAQQIDSANIARDLTERFIRRTDTMLLQDNGPKSVINGITALQPTIRDVVTNEYGVESAQLSLFYLLAELDKLRTKITKFRVDNSAWAVIASNAAILTDLEGRIAEFKTAIKAIDRNSDQGKAFLRHQLWLKSWQQQMTTIETTGEKSFELAEFEVNCSVAFSREKKTKIELVMRDRLSDATAGTPQGIITVVCSAPISLSGGFGFSTIDEKDFVFVQSTKTTTDAMGKPVQSVINRFGFRNDSSFRTLPVLLVNTRVWEPSDVFALHASAGAGVDVKTGQAGTDIEYVVGPSLSFRRSIFITPGVHIGRVPMLVGGFKLDDEVPTGVSQPPITKKWSKGFAITFTYFIR